LYLRDSYNKEEISKKIDKILSEKFQDLKVSLLNNHKRTEREIYLTEIIEKLLEKELILAGNGLLLRNQDYRQSALAFLGNYLMDMRVKDKKKQFEFVNSNPALSKIYKNRQLVDKLLGNSYYGVMGEPNSIFYNIYTAGAITGSGVNIISTATMGFEKFFGNQVFFKYDDVYFFISETLKDIKNIPDDYKDGIFDNVPIKRIDNKLLSKFVNSFKFNYDNENEFEIFQTFLKNLSNFQKYFLYYKNNFYEFIKLDLPKSFLEVLIDGDFLKVDDYLKEDLENINSDDLDNLRTFWELLDYYVADYTIEYDKEYKVNNINRRTVLVVDTDSNFLYLDPFLQEVKKLFEIKKITDKRKISIVNIITYSLVKYIKKLLFHLTDQMNIPDKYKDEIRMKSEFLFERVILTSNKKQYVGKIIYQEGVILDKPDIEYKGLQIKKAQVSKTTGTFFKDLIKNKFFEKDIKLNEILREILNFQEKIRNDILAGNTYYATNQKLNSRDSYKFPERISAYRGAKVWNALFPENPILTGDKCGLYKTTLLSVDDLLELKKTDFKLAKKLFHTIFKDPELEKYGMNVIAFPKNVKKLPEWIVSFIDIETIITDNITNGLIMLESLGLKTHVVKNNKYVSNIIQI
jgi:hypothetical protein